jgi:hypothetical protein
MNRFLVACALAALLLTSCGALWFAAGAAAVYYGEYYYDDCDDHYHCDDYYYATWNPQAVVANDFDGDGLSTPRSGTVSTDGVARPRSRAWSRAGAPARSPRRAGADDPLPRGGEDGAGLSSWALTGRWRRSGDGFEGSALHPRPAPPRLRGRADRARLDADDADTRCTGAGSGASPSAAGWTFAGRS